MSADILLIEVVDGVQVMTINRPDVKNAANYELTLAFEAAITELERNDDLRVGIITGAGGNFCTGMDLKGFLAGKKPTIAGKGFCALTEYTSKKPLISAIEGYALAGGFELALATDLIIAADNAKFGLPEVKRGLVAAAGGLLRLPQRMPYHIAMEYVLTGDIFTAQQASQHGLINRLTAPGQALEVALELGKKLAKNAPLALAASKSIIQKTKNLDLTLAFDVQRSISVPLFQSEDAKEGAQAFAEKREPVWRNK